MYLCDICKVLSNRRAHFLACNHSVCASCIGDLIWDNRDKHFLCCLQPSCPICDETTDIVVETFGGESRMYIDKP